MNPPVPAESFRAGGWSRHRRAFVDTPAPATRGSFPPSRRQPLSPGRQAAPRVPAQSPGMTSPRHRQSVSFSTKRKVRGDFPLPRQLCRGTHHARSFGVSGSMVRQHDRQRRRSRRFLTHPPHRDHGSGTHTELVAHLLDQMAPRRPNHRLVGTGHAAANASDLRSRSQHEGWQRCHRSTAPQFGRSCPGHAHDDDDENTTTASGWGMEVKP